MQNQFPTKQQADELATRMWAGVDASERLENDLGRMEEAQLMSVEQVGVLTLLADSVEAAAEELVARGRRIRGLAVERYQEQAIEDCS